MQEAIKKVNEWIALNNPNKLLLLNDMNLEKLPQIPLNCQRLYCYDNRLTFIPELPNCLELICCNNKLVALPKLFYCKRLICASNNLTHLPELPKCLALGCENNKLTHLPELPKCKYLSCDGNKLTFLPNLPNCRDLACTNNQLIYIPYLPKCTEIKYKNNRYLHINKKQAQLLHLKEKPNYNKYATIIQRNYKNHLRKKYHDIISQYLFKGPANLVCLLAI